MATFDSAFFYRLDEHGNSSNGVVQSEITFGSATATEATNDGVATIGESFTVQFNNPGTEASFGGTYTYIGHDPDVAGVIGQDSNGDYFLFSNTAVATGTQINGFVAEDFTLCFLAGTLIATPKGPIAVEDLAIGDLVLTADSRAVPVKWLGRQVLAAPFGMIEGRSPVVIEAGALDDDVPVRPLRVTADHALMIDGVLVQAGALVNGSTIRRLSSAELGWRFVVYHVETENHEVILAEGAPAETFIDNATRRVFDNYTEYVAMFGSESGMIEELPHPRAMSARQVPPTIRARIATRARALAGRSAVAAKQQCKLDATLW